MFFHYKTLFLSGMALFFIAIFIALFTTWDVTFSHYFVLSSSNSFLFIIKFISDIASFAIVSPLSLLLGIWLWVKKRKYEAIWVVATMFLCRVAFTALKLLVSRERPHFDNPLTHAISYSFPSGHAVNSFVFLFICYFIFSRRKSILLTCFLGSILVGWVRLALGAHWLSDIIAGWGCGLMWVAIAYQAKISIPLQNYVHKYFPYQ